MVDAWSQMPNMVERRIHHGYVAIRNKLFVFYDIFDLEVIDTASQKFAVFVDYFYTRPVLTDTSKTYFFFERKMFYF